MKPSDIGKSYDQITDRWEAANFDKSNGIEQHRKAISFLDKRGNALDVGCGSTGRFIDLFLGFGFVPEGIDVSAKMIKLAMERHPDLNFYQQDICDFEMPNKYALISAWDSIWHIPLNLQTTVLTKLVSNLEKNGVLIFSFGGTDEANEHKNSAMGPELYYSTLGVSGFLKLVMELGCTARHLEFDQYPEPHAYLIVQKNL